MSYERYLAGEPVIITAALTGGVHGKEASPAVPETPEEIGQAAGEAEAAGAAIVHLHARRPTGERSFATERFQEIDEAVRENTDDVIIQHSTGGTGAPADNRHQPLRTDPPPEMASLDMGPLNRYRHLTSENTRGLVDSLYTEMQSRNVKPEFELFNDGHINELQAFCEHHNPTEPLSASLLFGPGTLSPATPQNLLTATELLPDETLFTTLAFGQHQLPFAALGIVLGGNIRVGLEDNIYYQRGELAESNAQLVSRVAQLSQILGREVATPSRAREILGLD